MKRTILVFMALMVFIAFSAPETDARPRLGGGFKSGKRTYTPPNKTNTGNVSKTDPGKTTTSPGTAANRGFFSGGGLMRGLMIGGLAGLLFGGLFGNMGFLGDFLGLMVNVLAIYLLFILGRKVVMYFVEQRRLRNNRDNR